MGEFSDVSPQPPEPHPYAGEVEGTHPFTQAEKDAMVAEHLGQPPVEPTEQPTLEQPQTDPVLRIEVQAPSTEPGQPPVEESPVTAEHDGAQPDAPEQPEPAVPTAEQAVVIDAAAEIERASLLKERAHEVIERGHDKAAEADGGVLRIDGENGATKTSLIIEGQNDKLEMSASLGDNGLVLIRTVTTAEGSQQLRVKLDSSSATISGVLEKGDPNGRLTSPVQKLEAKHCQTVIDGVLGKLEEAVDQRVLNANNELDKTVSEILDFSPEL